MDIIEKRCDFKVSADPKEQACGKPVPDNEETEFALAPGSYSVDLCEEHRQMLADALAQFVEIGRPSRAITSVNSLGRKVLRGTGGLTFTSRDVRAWLLEQGREVPRSGRIPNVDIQEFRRVKGIQ